MSAIVSLEDNDTFYSNEVGLRGVKNKMYCERAT